jgi:uncharacterized membrane protein
MDDKRYRSVIKGITWRMFATIDTIIISWLITGKPKMAFSIGGIEVLTKIFLYYVHERTWNKIRLGRKHKFSDLRFLLNKRKNRKETRLAS